MLLTKLHSYQIHDGNNLPGAETCTWLKTQFGRTQCWLKCRIIGNNRQKQSDANCIHCHFSCQNVCTTFLFCISRNRELGCHFTSFSDFSVLVGQTSASLNFSFLTWIALLENQSCLNTSEKSTLWWSCLGALPSLTRKHQTKWTLLWSSHTASITDLDLV